MTGGVRMKRLEITSLCAIALVMSGLTLIGWFHYEYSLTVMRMPTLLVVVMVVLIVLRLAILSRAHGLSPAFGESARPPSPATVGYRYSWTNAAMRLLAVLPFVQLLGFPLGLGAFAMAFTKARGLGWRTATTLGLGMTLLAYLGFVELLSVPLPVVPFWVESLLSG